MKKILLTTISVLALGGFVNAQSVPFSNCDNWAAKEGGAETYDTLDGFDSGFDVLQNPVIATFKDGDVKAEGTASARVESFITSGVHLAGMLGSKVAGTDYGNASYTMYYRINGVAALVCQPTHAVGLAQVPNSASFQFKSEGEVGDSALVAFSFYKFDVANETSTLIGTCQQRIALQAAGGNFETVTIPYEAVVPDEIPDSVGFVMINSMNIYTTADANLPIAKVWMDDMKINYGNVGISFDHLAKQSPVAVYPNPAVGSTQIEVNPKDVSAVEIFTVAGAKVKSVQINSAKTTLDLQEFSTGAYLIKAIDKFGGVYQNGRQLIVK